MNVSIEFNKLTHDSNRGIRRTRISTLRNVNLERAITISQALQDNPNVEAVIMVEGDRQTARVLQLGQRLRSDLAAWLRDLRRPQAQPVTQRPRPAQQVPGRLASAG
jgi:hypothetical protein